ncbi:MAG: hypothetical protein P8O07_11735 [Crocinitomicaceae bacterium]|nr:hypothetical protein [Crocinitomicaceae bacterium]
MLRKQFVIQAVGESVIPLLGFFWFNWDLYFIALFYLLDLLVTEVFYQLKLTKITQFQKQSIPYLRRFQSAGFTLAILGMSHVMLRMMYPELDFGKDFIAFLVYEEAGIPIPQGIILLPLVVLGNYQQYKLFFLVPKRFRGIAWQVLLTSRRRALVLAIAALILFSALLCKVMLPEILVLSAFVVGKFWIDLQRSVN